MQNEPNELDSDSLMRLAADFPLHTDIKRDPFLHETSYNKVEVKFQIHAVDGRAYAWVHKYALVSSLIKPCGGRVLRIRTSLHTGRSMFHDTVAVIILAQAICLQFDLLKRESKGVRCWL